MFVVRGTVEPRVQLYLCLARTDFSLIWHGRVCPIWLWFRWVSVRLLRHVVIDDSLQLGTIKHSWCWSLKNTTMCVLVCVCYGSYYLFPSCVLALFPLTFSLLLYREFKAKGGLFKSPFTLFYIYFLHSQSVSKSVLTFPLAHTSCLHISWHHLIFSTPPMRSKLNCVCEWMCVS